MTHKLWVDLKNETITAVDNKQDKQSTVGQVALLLQSK